MIARLGYWILGVLIGLDITLNALLGGDHYETVSCRIGESILAGGWATYVPWPGFLRRHFLDSVYTTTV